MASPSEDGRRERADSAALVRDARELSGARYRRRPTGLIRRLGRQLLDLVGEFVAELAFTGVALLLFAGVAAVTVWGWQRSPVATIGAYVTVLAFLGYGAYALWAAHRDPNQKLSRARIATAAAGSTIAVAFWLSYVLSG